VTHPSAPTVAGTDPTAVPTSTECGLAETNDGATNRSRSTERAPGHERDSVGRSSTGSASHAVAGSPSTALWPPTVTSPVSIDDTETRTGEATGNDAPGRGRAVSRRSYAAFTGVLKKRSMPCGSSPARARNWSHPPPKHAPRSPSPRSNA
jgi:hypothetical protein